jgi:hypothetical protein
MIDDLKPRLKGVKINFVTIKVKFSTIWKIITKNLSRLKRG